ncbi:MAG TPA: hypothetical protein QGF58_09680 [Myxococcota bacterium]|nr:hypothetical protein [Myxococcota bacterium]
MPEHGLDRKTHESAAGLFKAFDKLLRAIRLYEGEGPLVDRLVEEVATRAKDTVVGELTLRVTPVGLVLDGKPLISGDDKVPSYLFELFCDGARELTLIEGIDGPQIHKLAEVFTAQFADEEEDRVTLLWKADLTHIRYFATDTLEVGEYVDEETQSQLASGRQVRGLSGTGDGDEVVLSSDDLRILRTNEALLWVRDARTPMTAPEKLEDAIAMVRKSFETPSDHRRFLAMTIRFGVDEPGVASPLALGHYDALLMSRDHEGLAATLEGLAALMPRAGTPGKTLRAALFEPRRLAGIAPIVEHHPGTTLSALSALCGEELAPLVGLLNHLRPGKPQQLLQSMLEEGGVDLSAFYTRGLDDPDIEVVVAAVKSLARTGTPQAYGEIAKALAHTLTPVRQAALQALVGNYVESARLSLGRALRDPVRENRFLALDVLEHSGETRAAGLILGAMQDSGFSSRDDEEQGAFYKALASFEDPRTVSFFARVLMSSNITRSEGLERRQIQAAQALARIKTDESRAALAKSRGRWRLSPRVRSAVDDATREST